jgi:hypothetical protein
MSAPAPQVEFITGYAWTALDSAGQMQLGQVTTQAYAVCPCGQRVWLGHPVNPCPVCNRCYDRWGSFLAPVEGEVFADQ